MWCYTLFPKILNMSLTAVIIIALVLLARLPLRKAPKVFSYALWAVVLFRLVCPLSFSSEFSLLGLFNTPTATASNSGIYSSITYIPSDIVHTEYPRVDLPLPGVSKAINENLPQGREQIAADPLEFPMSSATILWLCGIVAMLIYSLYSLLRLKRKLVGAVRLRENIYLADRIATPFVIGVIRPKIYLPSTLLEREREYIILHERTHIRRLDHIVKLLSFLALTLHWFNPLVWLAFILSGKDMEMSCDEAVMKKMDGDIRADYSASLLSLATGRKIFAGAPLAFGEGDTKSRIKNVMNYKKPAFWVVIATLVAVLAICVGLAANPRNNTSFTDSLLQYRTEYIGDNSKVGGIISALKYPDKVTYRSFELYTEGPPLMVTVKLDTDTETRNFYTGALNEGPFRKNAIIMFSLIHNAEYITFELNDGTNPYSMQFTRDMADRFVDGDVWSYSASPEQFETLLQMVESIEVTEPETWNPQPEYENQDDYSKALDAAQKSVKTEEIAVDDKGQNEKTALAWMEAYLGMYKALPKDNMAYLAQGVVDRLKITQISKEGLPKAFIFSVTFSVRPTYPIASNAFWMAGNTGNSPGRDETWGQMSREVELRRDDDGRYHFVSIGTGGAGNPDIYDMVDDTGATGEVNGLFSYSVSDIEKIEFQDGNTGGLASYTDEKDINDIIEHLNAFRYDKIEPVASDGWTYAIRLWFKDGSDMQRITLTPSSAKIDRNHYISSEHEYFPQEWLEQYRTKAAENGMAERVVTEYLEVEKDKDYVLSLSIAEVKVSDEETARIKDMYSGSELAKKNGWTDEYIAQNMIVVYARYTVDYDNKKVPYNEGKLEQYFYLTRASLNAEWTIWDSTSPSDLKP